jgi:sec-independent protein translocase protein TatB
MFDIGWPELLVILVVALIVIGPKDLPYALRTVGRWIGKARAMAREFQTHVDDMMRETELDELRKQATQVKDALDVRKHVADTVDPDGSLREAVSIPDPLKPAGEPRPAQPATAQPATAQPATAQPATALSTPVPAAPAQPASAQPAPAAPAAPVNGSATPAPPQVVAGAEAPPRPDPAAAEPARTGTEGHR